MRPASGRIFGVTSQVLLACACAALGAGACADAPPAEDATRGRVVVISLDGFSHQLYTGDPATAALVTLRALEREGGSAEGVQSTFPATTANAHAALWTGTYGSVNGITSNEIPRLPRIRHTILDLQAGFRAEGLLVEPIWAVAARQGVRVVAHQTPQGYPFLPINTAPGAPIPPVIVNGYQTRRFAPYAWITEDTADADADGWREPPESSRPPRFISWTSGDLAFRAAIVAAAPDAPYDAMVVMQRDGTASVRVPAQPTDESVLDERALARHFVELPVEVDGRIVAGVSLRLFDLDADGERFALLQSEIREVAIHTGADDAAGVVTELVTAEGGFIGNGAGALYFLGRMGLPLWAGGDGEAERRYLETVELVARQFSRHATWLWNRYSPQLMLDYLPLPDEAEHAWLGLQQAARRDGNVPLADTWEALRTRVYAIVDRRVRTIATALTPDDALVVVGDHGLTAVEKEVRVNVALAEAGLVARAPDGGIDQARSAVIYGRHGILVNDESWKGGIVAASDRSTVIAQAREVVESLADPATGARVVAAVFSPDVEDPPGLGGAAGFDLYLDFTDGYRDSTSLQDPVVGPLPRPLGDHGGDPRRPGMWTQLIVRAPAVVPGTRWPLLRLVDVTALVSDLIGIEPPPDAVGRSPLR